MWSRAAIRSFILCALMSLAPPVWAAEAKMSVIEKFETAEGWTKFQGDGVGFDIGSEEGVEGRALALRFDFTGNKAFAVAGKKMPVRLPENYKLTFYVRGDAPDNHLELKLVDAAGNVFWKKFSDFAFPKDWRKISILKRDITFAWGPSKYDDLREVDRMEVGVSCGSGGTGAVWFDELTLVELPASPPEPKPDLQRARVTASSVQEDRFGAKAAMDGDFGTRWSSGFNDAEWLVIDLGEIRDLAGLTIFWEAAFGEAYDVLLSEDGDVYRTVHTEARGDGNRDLIFFRKQNARFIKIAGRRRGTAWGYSIFEVQPVFGAVAPDITASSNPHDAPAALDGDPQTVWAAGKGARQSLTIDFKKSMSLGGFFIRLGSSPVVRRVVSVSDDGESWEEVVSSNRRAAGTDYIFMPATDGRYFKLDLTATGGPPAVADITLKGPEEKSTPQRILEIAALESPRGSYPRWLSKQQEYWTVVGAVDDDQESLLSEDGVLEPWHRSHTVAPFLKINGRLRTYADVETEQELADGYLPLPRVVWKSVECDLIIEAFAAGSAQKTSTYLTYTVVNKTAAPLAGQFYLAIRPLQVNPPWMHGGLAEIRTIEYDRLKPGFMSLNGRPALFVPRPPDTYGTAAFKSADQYGDIVEDIRAGALSVGADTFSDPQGLGSAALEYAFNIEPGARAQWNFAVPLHEESEIDPAGVRDAGTWGAGGADPAGDVEAGRSAVLEFWRDKLSRIRIELPDTEFVRTLQSNIAYILINDDRFRLQPGSRNYEASWMRDGSIAAQALLAMGYTSEVERYLNWISGFVGADGWVPFIVSNTDKIETHGWKEFDSQGQYIFALLQYYLYTKDEPFLRDKAGRIDSDVQFIRNLRAERKTADYEKPDQREFFGLFPESVSHEGYIDPPRHSYWDCFWGVRGLEDAARIFRILGDGEKSKRAEEERRDFQTCLYESIGRVVEKKKIDYMPGCAELGDPDPTASAAALWPCGQLGNLPRPLALATFERYWTDLQKRGDPNWKGGFTPYEIRNANAYLLTGQADRAHSSTTAFV